MDTTRQIPVVRQHGEIGTSQHGGCDGSPELGTGIQTINELIAFVGITERDVMAVRRHDGHRHLTGDTKLDTWCPLALNALRRLKRVLGEQTTHDIGTFHIVVVEVDQHLVAFLRSEIGSSARGGHRCDHTDPGRGHI